MTSTSDAATTVQSMLNAFLAGDADTFMSHVDDNIEWNAAEHHPFLTQYRGRQQFAEGAVATTLAVLDDFRFDIERVVACGDVAVTQLRYRGTVKHTGRSLAVQAAIVWEVRDGKVVRTQEYMDTLEFAQAWQSGGPTDEAPTP